VSTSSQTLLLHGALKQALSVWIEFAMRTDLTRRHLCVGEDLFHPTS
jgi:hypothetical protein